MNNTKSQTYFFFGLLTLAVVVSFFVFRFYITPVILAIALMSLFRPVYIKALIITRQHRGLAAFGTVMLALVLVLLPLVFFGIQVVKEAGDLYLSIMRGGSGASFTETINLFIGKNMPWMSPLSLDIGQYVAGSLNWLVANVGSIFSSFVGIAGSFVLSLIALYYFLKDGTSLRKNLIIWSPLSSTYDEEILDRLGRAVDSVMRGALIVAVIQGLVAGIGFVVFGLPQPALWSLVTMVGALVPLVGTTVITIPAAIYLFATGGAVQGIGLLIWAVLIAASIDNIIRPWLIERGVPIHPFLILLSVLGGIQLFGPIGFVLGPLVLSFTSTLLSIYPRITQAEK